MTPDEFLVKINTLGSYKTYSEWEELFHSVLAHEKLLHVLNDIEIRDIGSLNSYEEYLYLKTVNDRETAKCLVLSSFTLILREIVYNMDLHEMLTTLKSLTLITDLALKHTEERRALEYQSRYLEHQRVLNRTRYRNERRKRVRARRWLAKAEKADPRGDKELEKYVDEIAEVLDQESQCMGLERFNKTLDEVVAFLHKEVQRKERLNMDAPGFNEQIEGTNLVKDTAPSLD